MSNPQARVPFNKHTYFHRRDMLSIIGVALTSEIDPNDGLEYDMLSVRVQNEHAPRAFRSTKTYIMPVDDNPLAHMLIGMLRDTEKRRAR